MKLIQILKLAVIPVLTVLSLLSASNKVLANSNYYLKVWSNEANPESDAYSTTATFTSTREALIYFDCSYAERSLPECPR